MHKLSIAIITSLALTGSVAGAATFHRLAVSQPAGSLGASTTLQSSSTGGAIQGEVNTAANTSIKIPFGVLGEYDASSSTFGAGVLGLSSSGYGIGAETFATNNPSVLALAGSTGDALDAFSDTSGSAPAIHAEAAGSGDGIDGSADAAGDGGVFTSKTGTGVVGIVNSGPNTGGLFSAEGSGGAIAAISSSSNAAVEAFGSDAVVGVLATDGSAVVGYSGSGSTTEPIFASVATAANTPLFDAFTEGSNAPAFAIQGSSADRSGHVVANYASDVQTNGDLYVYGRVYDECNAYPVVASTDCEDVTSSASETTSVVTRSATGAGIRMYGARRGAPAVEDDGSAQLVNGRAYIRIDPMFAATMARDRRYRVYVTPGGDSRGVFVSNRSLQGFEVHENQGGRSSVDFDYRIVAAPFGDRGERLAVVPRKAPQSAQPAAARDTHFLTQLARFRAQRASFAPIIKHAQALSRERPTDIVSLRR